MNFITGATGLLGSHIAEQLVARGERVRALVRPGSDVRFLESLGVELHHGDLSDPASMRAGMEGAEVVYHSAAKVGDWGRWEEFVRHGIEGTQNVLDACTTARVGRLVHISSISVYGHLKPRSEPVTEDEPLAERYWWWDYYPRSKVLAEGLVRAHAAKTGLPYVIMRPGWIYGPRDRHSIFRLANSLKWGQVWLLGWANNRLNTVYAGNAAEACILAGRSDRALGQAYNVSSDGAITQKEFIHAFARALGHRPPTWHMPFSIALFGAFCMEAPCRLIGTRYPPWITRYATWLVGRSVYYSTEKARRELGWVSRVGYEEGIVRTAEWYKSVIGKPAVEPVKV